MNFTPQHAVAVALWVIWCFFHSLLISARVTDCLKEKLGSSYAKYRLLYNIFAAATLLPIYLYSDRIETAPVFRWEGVLAILRYVMVITAMFLFIAGARHYRLSKVVGIDQIRTGKTSRLLTENEALSTTGIHGFIRHPWYAGALLIVWAREIGLVGLSTNIVLSLYLVIGAFLEEGKLVMAFGGAYREYQKRVSMLLPWKWLKLKLQAGCEKYNALE